MVTLTKQGQVPGLAWGRVVQSAQGIVCDVQVDTSSNVFYLIVGHLPWWFNRWGKHKGFNL